MKKEWGPAVWSFIHSFCARLDESQFEENKYLIYEFLSSLLNNLPCPECSINARRFILSVRIQHVKSKTHLCNIFYDFHNKVSMRVKHIENPQLFSPDILNKYKNRNIKQEFRNYHAAWVKHSNVPSVLAMTSTFIRNMYINNAISWMRKNLHIFEKSATV